MSDSRSVTSSVPPVAQLERLPVAALLLEAEGHAVSHMNAAARRLLRYDAVPAGLPLAAVLPEGLAATREGEACRAITREGRTLWVEVRHEGEWVMLHDVTLRVEREQATQRLIQNSPDVVARFDRLFRHVFVNDAVEVATGMPAAAWLGKTHRDLGLPPEFCAMWEDAISACLDTARETTCEFDFSGPAGPQFFQVRLVPEGREGEPPESVLAIARDVTPLKRAEQDLARQRALMTTMINAFPGAIAYFGPDYVHRAANDAAAHREGARCAADLIGRPLSDFLPDAEAHIAPLVQRVLETGEPFVAYGDEMMIHTPQGPEVRHRDFYLAPVPEAEGGGFVITSVDATERMRLERLVREQLEELRRADRYKDEFLSVISHELRTPLNFITGFASILEDGVHGPVNDAQREALGKILTGADRMLTLVDDLLEFAKLSSGHLELAIAPSRYALVVEEVVAAMAPLAARRGLTVTTAIAALPDVPMDGGRIGQVLLNLISNALKFTDAGGHVTVRVFREGAMLKTEVEDDGCGIAESDVPRLFRRFEQLDMSLTRVHGGTGLGLAISKAMVEAHGGEIGVRSRPGEGSTFWFTLPM